MRYIFFLLIPCIRTTKELQVWRHGDRTPSSVLPNDPNNDINSWVIGLGELTKVGAQQEFNLGKLIRKRYNTFISDEYSPFEVYYLKIIRNLTDIVVDLRKKLRLQQNIGIGTGSHGGIVFR